MESENFKERIITKSEKIQELLDCIAEIKKNNLFLDKLKILESKCYDYWIVLLKLRKIIYFR